MIKQLTTLLLALTLAGLHFAQAQNDEGFIYGRVTTIDDDVYEGPLRWGKEEVYWTDIFNAGKEDNENIEYLSRREYDDLERRRKSYVGRVVHWSWDWDWDRDFSHQFGCQFGELRRMVVTGRNRINVELQNGVMMELTGEGYNDVGTKIRVIDQEMGEVELRWSRVDQVEFLSTPKKIKRKFGEPLYGTVETRDDKFTGYIQWDHDERVGTDELDGDTRDGDLSIEFGRIESIERDGGGSTVVLKSGRELYLDGSNDVGSGHRGVIVTTDFGRVDIKWREFEKVTFTKAPGSGESYGSFKNQQELMGTVVDEDGKSYKGKIVYDLDEAYDFEILHGEDRNEIEYLIPFDKIASITPRGYNESEVSLKNGNKLRLEESQDVSEDNTGVLIFEDKNDPTYVRWGDIQEIKFN